MNASDGVSNLISMDRQQVLYGKKVILPYFSGLTVAVTEAVSGRFRYTTA